MDLMTYVMSICGGFISEAFARFRLSYKDALGSYHIRVRENLQPQTHFLVNVFDIQQQYYLLILSNCFYLVIAFFFFVMMKKRNSGLRLRWFMVFYDSLNVFIAGYISLNVLKYKLTHGLLLCNTIVNDSAGYKIAHVFVLFYLQKYFEMIDTYLFLLRKSSRQVFKKHYYVSTFCITLV